MSNQIESILKDYLFTSGVKNKWYEGDMNDEDEAQDLLRSFLNQDITFKDDRLELMYQEGGGEGNGEHVEAVFKLDGIYFKATWNYYSHYGFDWDGLEFEEVVPVEKTVTVYESIA